MGSKKSRGRKASAQLRKRLAQVRACEESGETLKAYATRRKISVHALYQAKKQARQQGLLAAYGTGKTRTNTSTEPPLGTTWSSLQPRPTSKVAAS